MTQAARRWPGRRERSGSGTGRVLGHPGLAGLLRRQNLTKVRRCPNAVSGFVSTLPRQSEDKASVRRAVIETLDDMLVAQRQGIGNIGESC